MTTIRWDYLIVTASNDAQAKAYESQLALRQRLGLLNGIGQAMVVADPGGRRVGSGGSTVYCLMKVLGQEAQGDWESLLKRLRILILHAGGDSKRLPAYGPCGKIFVPVPGPSAGPVPLTLFDRILPSFMEISEGLQGAGQTVVASADVLLQFDPSAASFRQPGATALGCYATPEAASKHGVFCASENGHVRLFLQKPSPAEQVRYGAVNSNGRTILDVGVMSFDAATAMAFMHACEVRTGESGELVFSPEMNQLIMNKGLDLYREICCAMGLEATAEHHLASARSSGSSWDESSLAKVFCVINPLPFSIQILPQCEFLHFGTTGQLISSGMELAGPGARLEMNNRMGAQGTITGPASWVEGCDMQATLTLAGQNVVVGLDVDTPLSLPEGACVDVLRGTSRAWAGVWFVRCCGVKDAFKDLASEGGLFCGRQMLKWLEAAGMKAEDVWDASVAPAKRSLWDARVCPAEPTNTGYRNWLWMFNPAMATEAQKKAFLAADRYSSAEIAMRTDQDAFYERRMALGG